MRVEGEQDPGRKGALGLIAERQFGSYFIGNSIAAVGIWVHNVAAAVVVHDMTGSALMVGLVSVMQFAATMLLSAWVGAVADRRDRRRILMAGQVVSAAGAGMLAVWTALVGVDGLPGPWPVFAAAFVIGLGFALSAPTGQAIIPALVAPDDLEEAVSLQALSFNLARGIGPVAGALLLGGLGAAATFLISTASFIVLVVVLVFVKPRVLVRSETAGRSVVDGLRYVRRDPALVLLLATLPLLAVAVDPVITLTPALADDMGGDETLVGILATAFGAGSIVAIAMLSRARRRWGTERLGVGGFTVLGIGMMLAGLADTVAPAVVWLAVAGLGFLAAITAVTSQIQRLVLEDYRGRVMALWTLAFLGSRPVAALFNGGLADATSVSVALLCAGMLAFAGAVLARPRPTAAVA